MCREIVEKGLTMLHRASSLCPAKELVMLLASGRCLVVRQRLGPHETDEMFRGPAVRYL
jgi:hypothetical protein